MRKAVWGVLITALVVLAACLGLQLAGGDDKATMQFPEDEGVSSAQSAASIVKEDPGTIREGTWEVGTDVKPGKYKTPGPTRGPIPLCYWDVKTGETFVDQGVKDKVGAQGIVNLKKGQVFTTNGCEPWVLDGAKPVGWFTPKTTPVKNRKVYVIETFPASWPVASAQAFVDRYTGSNWVMAKTCPAGAYRCIFVKAGNLDAPRLAETRDYRSARVTIVVDLAYANPRARTGTAKKWVLAHEFGHAAGLREHTSSCSNFMHATTRCMRWGVTASQKRIMSAR
jgi:hypothetical protein